MRRDSRLSGVLHILLHMAEQDTPVTSESLAKAMDTHPVVIRRVLAGLRERGYVRSGKGFGGGWTLESDLSDITLYDVYIALGSPTLLAVGHRSEEPLCPVEQSVNAALDEAYQVAEERLLAQLREVTLADLRDGAERRAARLDGVRNLERAQLHGP